MASYPEGILSFLYHITYDFEVNLKFKESCTAVEEVMDFFMIRDPETRKITLETWHEEYEAHEHCKEPDPAVINRAVAHLLRKLDQELRDGYERVW